MFNEESIYIFNNVQLNNITTNSNYLLYFINHNIILKQVKFKDINCLGDENDSSLILFDSGENDNQLILNDIVIDNNKSNGSLIQIIGNSCQLAVSNSKIENVISYGPIIKCTCDKVIIIIKYIIKKNNIFTKIY